MVHHEHLCSIQCNEWELDWAAKPSYYSFLLKEIDKSMSKMIPFFFLSFFLSLENKNNNNVDEEDEESKERIHFVPEEEHPLN